MRAKLADAISLWQRGRHQEAEHTCAALLATSRNQTEVRALLAEIYGSRGQFRAASEQLRRIADLNSRDAAVWRRLGDAQFACDELTAAAESFARAIEIEPTHPRAHNNLGRALARLGQLDAAIDSYRRAIDLDPNYAIAHNNLGMALGERNQLEEALACYERAAALNPQFAETIGNQGNLLVRLDRAQEALTCYERALALHPGNATLLCNAGHALLQLGRFRQALTWFEHALRVIPDFPQALLCRGNALKELRRFDEALASYERAIGLQPDYLEALTNKAGILLDLERFDQAIDTCDEILRLRPDFPQALLLRGLSLNYLGGLRYEDAVTTFAKLLEVAPNLHYAPGSLLHTSAQIFDWSHTQRIPETLRGTREGRPVITPLALLAVSDDAALQLSCARTCIATTHPATPVPLWHGEHWQSEKIRVAYLSGDLRDHPLSYLMVGVFEKHDRDKFEILGVSYREPVNNPFGARVLSALDIFLDIHEQTDQQAAQLLYDMKVDMVVDLMGITRGHRLNILSHRPAPVQVGYLGFPATCGAPYIDYILADEFVIPKSSRCHYSESVVYMPDCFQANDDRRAIGETPARRSDVGLPEEGFVFCSFNSCYKVTPAMFDVWCRLLRARPHSVLWVLAESAIGQVNLQREASLRGVDRQRLVFAARTPYDQHLARLGLADLFLDTLPFNAGTTASDALWAGLPVLTCPGEAFAARMAGSLLRTIGLPELIVSDLEAYERLALQLSASPEWLRTLRMRLEVNRATHPLFDTLRFCRHLESAYETMHQRRLRGEPPAHFSVAPPAMPSAVRGLASSR